MKDVAWSNKWGVWKGTGSKLVLHTSSLNREKVPCFCWCSVTRRRKLFYLWTQNSYLYTLFSNSDNFINFISSRLLTSFASLSTQIKPVKYLVDKKKLGNNVSYFTFFFNFSKQWRKLSFTNKDLVFHTNYYFGIYLSKRINSSLYSYKCVTWSK